MIFNILMIFGIKEKSIIKSMVSVLALCSNLSFPIRDNKVESESESDNFEPYNVFWAIAANIPVRLLTGFVVQGHIQ